MLVTELSSDEQIIMGNLIMLSLPLRYFKKYRLPLDWNNFLDDLQHNWPTDDTIILT